MKITADNLCFILGIDVGKLTCVAHLLCTDESHSAHRQHLEFSNNAAGFKKLRSWLGKLRAPTGGLHVVMEATGGYEQSLAEECHTWAARTSVLNPAQIKHFARSQLRRAKTDTVDAAILAQYGQLHRPAPWQPLHPRIKELRALLRRRTQLIGMRTAETNRLQQTRDSWTQQSLRGHLAFLNTQIKTLEQQLRTLVKSDSGLKAQVELLTSIRGFGTHTACVLLGELGDISRYQSARQWAAHAGLTPAPHQSGQHTGHAAISRIGSAPLRSALYLPALTALRHLPQLQIFAQRLRDKGRATKQILCAIMRRLLHWAYGVLKHQKPFDGTIAFHEHHHHLPTIEATS